VRQVRLPLGLVDEPQVQAPVAGAGAGGAVLDLEEETVGVLVGLGVPGAGVVAEGHLAHALMPRQPGRQVRDRVEGRQVQEGAGGGDVDVRLHHHAERGAAGPDGVADRLQPGQEVQVVQDRLRLALQEPLPPEQIVVDAHPSSMGHRRLRLRI